MTECEQVIAELLYLKRDCLEGSATDQTLDKALALLKAQEPVEPMIKREGYNKYFHNYVCPICDQDLTYEQCYCSECGRELKWE